MTCRTTMAGCVGCLSVLLSFAVLPALAAGQAETPASKEQAARRELAAGRRPEANLARKPNLLVMFTDDQRADALSCAGHPFIKTPHIDRLAAEGVRFNNAFVTISLCSPSRACILTGQYAHTHGVMRNDGTDLPESAVTYPKLLQKAGYQTAYIGKWHMGRSDEKRAGFDYWVSYVGQGKYIDPPINVDGERMKGQGHMDDIMTDYALGWIREKRDKSRPFCMTLAFKTAHGPFTPPERHAHRYDDAEIRMPATHDEPLDNKPAFVRKWIETEHRKHMLFDHNVFIRNYNAALTGIDDNVGRMLDLLAKEGILDNTLIIYTSDNGYYQAEHGGLYDKRSAYEESIKVPMIVRFPRWMLEKGTVRDDLVLNIDIAPTLLRAAGVTVPKSMQGQSWYDFLSPLSSFHREPRKSVFIEYFHEKSFPSTPTLQAVRTPRWKYIRYLEPQDTPELYDLEADPLETKNLYKHPDYQHQVELMKQELERQLKDTGAAPAGGAPAEASP